MLFWDRHVKILWKYCTWKMLWKYWSCLQNYVMCSSTWIFYITASADTFFFFTAPFIAAKKYEVSVSCCIADIFRRLIKHALQRNVDDFLPLAAGEKRLKYHYKGSLHAFFMSRSEIHVHECIFHACFLTLMILHVFQLQSYCLNRTHACWYLLLHGCRTPDGLW